jgi:DNA invertase Pin-like site-specific DNA recombinase
VESGKNRQRPKLAEALRLCRVHRATLLVAKQDRLSRNAAQIMSMLDDAKVPFVCVDDPNTTKLNVGIKALIAEDEADKASARTKAALAVARTKGVQLGGKRGEWSVATVADKGRAASLDARRADAQKFKADLMPMIEDIRDSGVTTLLGHSGSIERTRGRDAARRRAVERGSGEPVAGVELTQNPVAITDTAPAPAGAFSCV